MKKTKVIGITGGVGAGKTSVLNLIEENYNVRIFITDQLAHEVMKPGTDCNRRLQEIFPAEVFDSEGNIRKDAMAQAMFTDDSLRSKCNAIVHPAVGEYLESQVASEREKNQLDYVIIESALYKNQGWVSLCDDIWNISVSKENRQKRLMDNRGYSQEKVASIFASQAEDDALRDKLAVQIDNNGDLDKTLKQINQAFQS